MRIGVLSDTHIPDRAEQIPQAIIEDFKNVDMIIHVGDFVAPEVLEELRSICPNIKAVTGNMDYEELKAILPEKEVVVIENKKIGITHGHGPSHRILDTVRYIFMGEHLDIIIFGHSHIALKQKRDNTLYFNPGSATDKIFSPYNSYGIIEINNGEVDAKIIKL